jgi:hypothetical protein
MLPAKQHNRARRLHVECAGRMLYSEIDDFLDARVWDGACVGEAVGRAAGLDCLEERHFGFLCLFL